MAAGRCMARGPLLRRRRTGALHAPRSEHRTADAAGVALFQSYGHCCDKEEDDGRLPATAPIKSLEEVGEVVGTEFRVRPCRCPRGFCEHCGPKLGWKLRQRLLARLKSFKSVFGITLTLDGSLFTDPREAWSYVMTERLLSRLVRELYRRGRLLSRAYFWSVEFQKDTKQAHWHLVVEAEWIPYGELVEIWSRFRPDSAAPLEEKVTAENYKGRAPAFGSVQFTRPTDAYRGAYYATKYLVKHPEEGYPEWVLGMRRMQRTRP